MKSVVVCIASIVLLAVSVVFKIAGKMRLTIPLLYLIAASVSTFFTGWTAEHETLILAGLFVLTGLSLLSWVWTLVNRIRT